MKWLAFGSVFIVGLAIGAFLPAVAHLQFSKEIDSGDFFSALVTLVVAVVFGYLYTERVSAKKADTDLMLECMREIRASLTTLQAAALPCHRNKKLTLVEQASLTVAERELSNAVHSLEIAVNMCPKDGRFEIAALKDARVALKDSLTDTPFPGPYSDVFRAKIVAAQKAFRDEVIRVSFAIIRR